MMDQNQIGESMFSKEYQEALRLGKYTSWAKGLTEENLSGLLWMVGEYGLRAFLIIEILEKHYDQLPKPDPAFARALTALRTIETTVLGEPCPLEHAKNIIREAVRTDEDLAKH